MAQAQATGPIVIGRTVAQAVERVDVLERARQQYQHTVQLEAQRASQIIRFDTDQPIGLALMADLHFGGPGTDVDRIMSDAALIAATDGLYCGFVGDMVDNFIVLKLAHARRDNRLSIPDEWALFRLLLRTVGSKLLLMIGGNHDYWTKSIAGIDYLADILASINPAALYDEDDARVTVEVGGVQWPGRLRHKWRGSSIYNDTHGIERTQKWDQDFVWGVGAHTHVSGLVRQFNAAGADGLALLCGAYKRVDVYARQVGFGKPNQSAAVMILFDPASGTMQGFNDLALSARVLTALRAHGQTTRQIDQRTSGQSGAAQQNRRAVRHRRAAA